MNESRTRSDEYDLFLSHATPDKEWVVTLAERLEELGVRVFVDSREIALGDSFVLRLSDGLVRSRYMVLVLSRHTEGRPWVQQEWTSFIAGHGPLGRLLPVRIDDVELPFILKATQALTATDRDAQRAASELFRVVGDPSKLGPDDERRLVLGRDLVFTLARDDDELHVTRPDGTTHTAPLPWKQVASFGVAHLEFGKLHREPTTQANDHAALYRHARTLGSAMFSALFDEAAAERFTKLLSPDRARPVVQIRSDDDLLQSLPWELLHHNDEFLVREGRIDLVRTTPADVAGETLLRKPAGPFRLVVNVSAPEGSHLSYEAESYRITLATADRCEMTPTELGTLDDLIEMVDDRQPTGIHFSGHGTPGALLFEDQEGREDPVAVKDVIDRLRRKVPDNRRLPPFFYLANCHGNDPTAPDEDGPGAPSAAVQLHKAGVTEVIGYFGPIMDALSTRAEEAVYEAIADGRTTRDAVRLARESLQRPLHDPDARHRPGAMRGEGVTAVEESAAAGAAAGDLFPFAWAQLVFYRRGPEWPLSVAVPAGKRQLARVLQRRFEGFGKRRVLQTGFIGRRLEQHKIRRRIREGARALVLQGLGGLGKSTLAQRVLPWLTDDPDKVCTLWCQEVEGETNRAEALVGQLLAYCREWFGLDWEQVVQQVDRAAGDDAAKRFVYFLHTLVQNAPGLVLYFDNLESLLVGPADDDADADTFGDWAEPALEAIWETADQMARDTQQLYLIASCRYRNDAFNRSLLPVTPLPADALFRLTEWFPGLQRLSTVTRARLVERLDGHARAVEYANDLIEDALVRWRDMRGEWSPAQPPTAEEVEQEWDELVDPCLPHVAEKLRDNLLLKALWERVLDETARRFLYRMTVLRRPVEWDLLTLLGDPDQPPARVHATAERLRDTSLLEQVELLVRVSKDRVGESTRYTLHPATERFIRGAYGDRTELRLQAHRRLGEHLAATAADSRCIETDIEAAHHLFEAGEYDRALESLSHAAHWLRSHGRAREGLQVLEPFLEPSLHEKMDPASLVRLLGWVGLSHYYLGQNRTAIGYYQQELIFARSMGDRKSEGTSLGNLGLAYMEMGEVEQAIEHCEEHLVIAREFGDRYGEGNALGNLGNAYALLGEVQKAIGYHERALVISRETGNKRGEGQDLGNLGHCYLRLGKLQQAITYSKQRLVIAREIGDRRGESNALGYLGTAYFNLNEPQQAFVYWEQQLGIAREIGDRRGEEHALGNLGVAYAVLDEVETAIGYYEQQLVIAREIGDRRGEGNALGNLGNAYADLDEVEKARTLLEQSKAIGEQIGDYGIVDTSTRVLQQLADA